MSGSVRVGDTVSFYGGRGTVVQIEGNLLYIHTDDGEIVIQKRQLPMVNKEQNFESGSKISFPGGEGEILKMKERSGDPDLLYIHTESGDLKTLPADRKDIEPLTGIADRLEDREFDGPARFRLRTEATKLDLAYRFDRFLSLTGNRIDISPHQVDAAREVLTSHDHRYLIGDEVGLGKTIEAAIIVEELIARGRADRVLIVTPASLATQWQAEMQEKFDRDYAIYDRDYIDSLSARQGNPWEHEDHIIASIDFAKQEEIREQLEDVEWDIAIFDEAHHLTARRSSDGTTSKTKRYQLGELISDRTDSLLFLTGTPHKGKHDQFYYMISLLAPYRFEDENDISPSELDDLMIRRLKSNPNMVHSDGTPMFPEKDIRTLSVEFNQDEESLYQDITEYLRTHYRRGEDQDARAAGFSTVIYQKRLVSSIYAIQKSLEKRAKALRGEGKDGLSQTVRHLLPQYRESSETLTDQQRERVEEELQMLTGDQDIEEISEELEILEDLIQRAKQVDIDSKGKRLRRFIGYLRDELPDEKVLVFTEYTDTLEYLRDQVLADFELAEIHGGMSQSARREQVDRFRDDIDIMLATDAAREGINLQFARIMINYDLPWNPIRIDQRMGRLHRYGQEQKVYIYNLFVEDSRESQILEQLVTKVDRIEEDLGMSSDVLGMVLDDSDFDLEDRIMDAITEGRSSDEVVEDIDRIIEERKEAVKTIQNEFLISDQFGEAELEEVQELIDESREDHVGQEKIRTLLERFFEMFGGRLDRQAHDADGIVRVDVPEVLELEEEVRGEYSKATFSRELAMEDEYTEFLSLNHKLVQAVVDYCLDGDWIDGRTAIERATDPGAEPGILLQFRLGYETADGSDHVEEFVRLFVTDDGEVSEEIPEPEPVTDTEAIADQDPVRKLCDGAAELVEAGRDQAQLTAEELAKEAQEKKEEEVSIKMDHARRYFEEALGTWESRLKEYQKKQQAGEDMKMPIRRARSEIEQLETERKHEFERLKEEQTVLPVTPELVNAAVVLPGTGR